MKNIIIAIDGHSSTGKSTLAKQLARKLHYIYVDSGAMYRAVTLYAMRKDFISNLGINKDELIKSLSNINLEFKLDNNNPNASIFLNGENVEGEIRGLEVSSFVSKIAEISEVRKVLVKQQQEIGKNRGIVMDGRDIGTVVFPDAELKIFMTASAETRAKRRYNELLSKGENVDYNLILENVIYRDNIDSTRSDSPLLKADDAIEVDNSNLSLEEQFNIVYNLALEKIN